MNRYLATILTPPLFPLLLVQGYWLRRTTPRLPDAAGPLVGTIAGTGDPLRLIALGESTVAGMGARTHETALAGQLALALNVATHRPIDWMVVARSGINARKSRAELGGPSRRCCNDRARRKRFHRVSQCAALGGRR